MKYKNAGEILPQELVEEIQKYILIDPKNPVKAEDNKK